MTTLENENRELIGDNFQTGNHASTREENL